MIDNSSLSRAVIKFAYFNDMTAHDWYSWKMSQTNLTTEEPI